MRSKPAFSTSQPIFPTTYQWEIFFLHLVLFSEGSPMSISGATSTFQKSQLWCVGGGRFVISGYGSADNASAFEGYFSQFLPLLSAKDRARGQFLERLRVLSNLQCHFCVQFGKCANEVTGSLLRFEVQTLPSALFLFNQYPKDT